LPAQAKLLGRLGPQLGRPRVDTLEGSKHATMMGLRFDVDGVVWHVAFALDPRREALLLVVAAKSGGSEAPFCRSLIAKSHRRFDSHIEKLAAEATDRAKSTSRPARR
jgi:hypothetical protein